MTLPKWAIDLFKPLLDVIEEFVTSGEERGQIRERIFAAQAELAQKALEYESALAQAQASVIVAEAKSESWLTRNWRPIVVIFFTALIGAHWLGFTPPGLENNEVIEVLLIVKLAIGGYVIGRSGEKIAKSLIEQRPTTEKLGKYAKALERLRIEE